MTDHFLLMTATPHKGDPENFCLFLSLLDKDVYGNIKSLQEAMRRNEAPFYLRRTKEALVSFPDPDDRNRPQALHQAGCEDRRVRPRRRRIRLLRRPHPLRRRPVDPRLGRGQCTRAEPSASPWPCSNAGWPRPSTLSGERSNGCGSKREKILADPEAYRKQQIEQRIPDDFDELPEDEQQHIIAQLEDVVASVDPAALRLEIASLSKLIDQARILEKREIESKLTRLKSVLKDQGFFSDPTRNSCSSPSTRTRSTSSWGTARTAGPSASSAVGAHRHPDPRRDEDRRPRHAGKPHLCRARVPRVRPGARRDRGRGRRDQSPVLLPDDQLRHPLEPRPARAAGRAHPPLRPGARLHHLQLRGQEHARGPGPCRNSWSGCGRSGTNSGPTRSSTWSAKFSRRTSWKSSSATSTPGGRTSTRSPTGSSETIDPTRFREITESALEGLAEEGSEPLGDHRQDRRGQGAAASCRKPSRISSSWRPRRPASIPRRPARRATSTGSEKSLAR